MNRSLVVLSCSGTKRDAPGLMPAIHRYNGPYYQDLRSYLRGNAWPSGFSVAVLSAKYGLIGGLTPIPDYDQRMNPGRARELRQSVTKTLLSWSDHHDEVRLVLGKDYLPAIDMAQLRRSGIEPVITGGRIGEKRQSLGRHLRQYPLQPRSGSTETLFVKSPMYFLPDWDDMLDTGYDFVADEFSAPNRADRKEQHCSSYMNPERICDGILISLAQRGTSKGLLRRFRPTDRSSLAPPSVRTRFGLDSSQLVFGDCGAFSYVAEDEPTFTVERACSLYELYGFDLGASVDHIPVPFIRRNGKKVLLSESERRRRIQVTKDNARRFIDVHKRYKCQFNPVGVIQALSPEEFAATALEYVRFGYRHVALGGLVPLPDAVILQTVEAVMEALGRLRQRPRVHLFGVFRPALQTAFRQLGVDSFDSATYFRKAWLRDSQNYLGVDGNWYGAIRVPMTTDGRTRKRFIEAGKSIARLAKMEQAALTALNEYDQGLISLEGAFSAVAEYDAQLNRTTGGDTPRLRRYRETLEKKPWKACDCNACRDLGIHVLVFRGYNRNKRRGAHNTLMLYRQAKGQT